MTELYCPTCDAVLDMRVVLKSREDHDAFERLLLTIGIPLMRRVLDYIDLHKPAMHRLSMTKKTKLIRSLAPDMERQAITRNGREWAAPHALWAQAIDGMLATRDAGGLDLPLKGNGYLYAVLQKMADKAEAAQERQAEADKRNPSAVSAAMAAKGIATAPSHAGTHAVMATLAALAQTDRTAAPMPAEVRAKLDALRGRKPAANPGPATNADTDTPNTEEPRP